ncbi:MAG: transketolase C-terminal domain-containing protein [Desulfatiglans sp.]|jgi:2-oxoglutarate ferredoxin oxidoreductase subunit alpha|nr:transketolase C-terminal domain-containing protein [Thermodesulfobacteriota bacterium]MEE4352422.1 transketolase C-terminal domain-containing protein [Desulfatiglans sp.]
MADKILTRGFEAIGLGALAAGCQVFPGCPTGPQDEFFKWLAEEFPKNGRHFVRTSSETSAINVAYGSGSAGGRVLVLVSSAGWGLIQESISNMANGFVPVVIVLVQKGGPGVGSASHGQMDYFATTRDAGNGNYRTITLAPYTVQEMYDLTQLAFHLADKWRNPVIISTDVIGIHLQESIETKILEYEPLPEKDWAVTGKGTHADGVRKYISSGQGFIPTPLFSQYLEFLEGLNGKVVGMRKEEQRYESYSLDDAEVVMVAYGYSAGTCREALKMARNQGIKAGLVRPITLWPFPAAPIEEKAKKGAKFLVVEDGLGGLDEDVKMVVQGECEVQVMSALDRKEPDETGMIYPEKVLERIKGLV